jgi:hypothetical protein
VQYGFGPPASEPVIDHSFDALEPTVVQTPAVMDQTVMR